MVEIEYMSKSILLVQNNGNGKTGGTTGRLAFGDDYMPMGDSGFSLRVGAIAANTIIK